MAREPFRFAPSPSPLLIGATDDTKKRNEKRIASIRETENEKKITADHRPENELLFTFTKL